MAVGEVADGGGNFGGDREDETIAAAGESFYEAWRVRGIAEGAADFVDGHVDGVIEIAGRGGGPNEIFYFFAGDHGAGAFEEGEKDFEGLFLERKANAGFTDFAGAAIDLKGGEAETRGRCLRWVHCRPEPMESMGETLA